MMNSIVLNMGWALALRNIRLQIIEHALGYAWALITPVLYAVCYIFIKQELAGNGGIFTEDAAWDALRAFSGIMLFQFWMQLVQDLSGMVRRHKGILRGMNVSSTPFILASMIEGWITLSIRAILIVAAVPILGLAFPANIESWIWLAMALLTLHLCGTAIGLLLLPWASLYPDVRQFLRSVNLPLVLVSPIFYPAVDDIGSPLYWVNAINPLASPLAIIASAVRDTHMSIYAYPMMLWMFLSVMVIFFSVRQLRHQIPILLERMGN